MFSFNIWIILNNKIEANIQPSLEHWIIHYSPWKAKTLDIPINFVHPIDFEFLYTENCFLYLSNFSSITQDIQRKTSTHSILAAWSPSSCEHQDDDNLKAREQCSFQLSRMYTFSFHSIGLSCPRGYVFQPIHVYWKSYTVCR